MNILLLTNFAELVCKNSGDAALLVIIGILLFIVYPLGILKFIHTTIKYDLDIAMEENGATVFFTVVWILISVIIGLLIGLGKILELIYC